MILILILALLALLAVLMTRVVCLGRLSARKGHTHVAAHRRAARLQLAATIVLIVLVEVLVRFVADETIRGSLFVVHLGFAVSYLISLITIIFFLTGVRVPNLHWQYGYTCASLFIGTFVTGIALLLPMLVATL